MPCARMRQASASPWFPCPKCGYPVNGSQGSKEYLGKEENPLDKDEEYVYYRCPDCGEIIKKLEIRYLRVKKE